MLADFGFYIQHDTPAAKFCSRVFLHTLLPTTMDEMMKGNMVIKILSGCSPESPTIILCG